MAGLPAICVLGPPLVCDVRMVGALEIGEDDGQVRITLPSALATVMASSAAWPMEGPVGRLDGRADGWLRPMQRRVAAVGNDAFELKLRAEWRFPT